MKLVWVKYRTTWAWGKGKWEYISFVKGTSKDEIERRFSELDWGSDKFRGVEWTYIRNPPKEIFDQKIKMVQQAIKYKTKELECLKQLIQ